MTPNYLRGKEVLGNTPVHCSGYKTLINIIFLILTASFSFIPLQDLGTTARSCKSVGKYICIMSGDTRVSLIELKLRSDTECVATRQSLLELPGVREERKYLDCSLLETGGSDLKLVLLGERKNKERFVSVVEVITSGRGFSLCGEELCVYDKASMLGKNLTHLASTHGSGDVFTCGNLIRKLKLEDAVLKPTSGRIQVPPECVDGTLSLCVVSVPQKNTFTILSSFKTKSASKNKFQINWFQGRNDEISPASGKSSLKLSEDQEPSVILSDPRDVRSFYVICNNSSDNTSGFYKLVRGRKLEDPITTFPHPVTEATMMMGSDNNLFLILLDTVNSGVKIFSVMKTQGYRGATVSWSKINESLSTFHAVSCSLNKWMLSPSTTDALLSARCPYQVALATLLAPNNDIACEPESGAQYRLRALGGDNLNDVILIILDDIERCFDTEEDTLASLTLKICMNTTPGGDGLSMLSGWLMAGRLSSVEIFSSRLDSDSFMDSDRMSVQSISLESLR